MSELKVSVSGIRGIWADSLTLDSLFTYTKAFGLYILSNKGHQVLIGRDARPTGALIVSYVSSILNGMGIDVIDTGIVPTPTVLYGVRKMNLDGGIIITASHNPIQWNALKFVKRGGVFTGEADIEQIKDFMEKPLKEAEYSKIGHYTLNQEIMSAHIREVLGKVDSAGIRKSKLKVVLDPVNSAGSLITQTMLKDLNCGCFVVNGEMNGTFARGTEPTPDNLRHLEQIVLSQKADAGFAQDPDADRLVLIDEKGRVLNEEMTLALAVDAVLSQKKGDVVINMSTSMLTEAITEKYGVKCHRTKVGEANVVEGIQKHKALIGGEGNGGVIYPAINIARDSLVGIALILERMAHTGKTLSELADSLPKYHMIKEKFDFSGNLGALLDNMKAEFPDAKVNELDGLRLDWKEGNHPVWLHVRASNTEPVVRLIGESDDLSVIKDVIEKTRKLVM